MGGDLAGVVDAVVSAAVRQFWGRGVHGFAAKPNVLVAVMDPEPPLAEIVRHEMVHLFSARWCFSANPLFSEGLAVWLQKTWYGFPVDECAAAVLAALDDPRLERVLLAAVAAFRPVCRVFFGIPVHLLSVPSCLGHGGGGVMRLLHRTRRSPSVPVRARPS